MMTTTTTQGTSAGPNAHAVTEPVPFLDLKSQYEGLRDEVHRALCEVADSTGYILGPRVAAFERAFADYIGSRHCVAVNSGTSALHLALICAGVKAGDDVLTVPMTFVATSWAISYVGARPVFVDIEPDTCTMDVDQVESRITSRTKAILPVHLYGQPADMEPLLEIGRRRGISVIEDCAQAHGATYQGRRAGTLGQTGCFSFYPGKNLGACGEGGAIVTDNDAIADRCRRLRDHAQGERYHHDELGFNYRMDAMQGAVLEIKLRHLEEWIEARRRVSARYFEGLGDLPLTLPVESAQRRHVRHLFVVRHPERDRIRKALDQRGIQTGLHYPIPVHLQKAYEPLGHQPGDFPVAEQVAHECFSLPMYPELTTTQQDRVIEALSEVIRNGF